VNDAPSQEPKPPFSAGQGGRASLRSHGLVVDVNGRGVGHAGLGGAPAVAGAVVVPDLPAPAGYGFRVGGWWS
jgi:hypothetical protein